MSSNFDVDFLDFIQSCDDAVEEVKNAPKQPKKRPPRLNHSFNKVEPKKPLKKVNMNLDKDGTLLKSWIEQQINKDDVFIKDEYFDYAEANNISHSKANRLLLEITEALGLTVAYATKYYQRTYKALQRIHYNAPFYKN